MAQQPTDRRTQDLARRLDNISAIVAAAKTHIAETYAQTDGIAAASLNDGSRSTDGTSTTERTTLVRIHLANQSAQINDDLDAIENIIRSLTQTSIHAIGTRAPTAHERCTANPGLDGYMQPLHEGGWYDPTCTNLPRSNTGLCNTCRVRLDRWRTRNEHKPLADDRTITHDSRIVIGQLGAIHTRPLEGAA